MKLFISVILFFILSLNCYPLEKVQFELIPGKRITFLEIKNLTQTVNSRYIGLLSREERGILVTEDYGSTYEGSFYLSRSLKHDARFVEKPLERTEEVLLDYNISTGFTVRGDSVHPELQGFPVFPEDPVGQGEKWKSYSIRYVDPLEKGNPTAVSFYCEYEYSGLTEYTGREAHLIKAKYALRYKNESGNGDPELAEIKYAGHDVDIYVFTDYGGILIIDKLGIRGGTQEEYNYFDGTHVIQSGTIITWINASVTMNRTEIIEDFNRKIDKSITEDDILPGFDDKNIKVTEVEQGVKLELTDIHFVADKAEILPDEKERLDLIAELLKSVPDRTIHVIGHTARVGDISNEQELSEERAHTIVKELIKRGIPAKRFIYEGRGGTEPVGDNSTEEGRRKNRRVEIIILED